MRRRTIWIILSAAVTVLVIAGTVVWLNAESYDETVAKCQKALVAQYKADGHGKPDACKDVKQDDYDALAVSAAIDGLGWTDENGDFDENKMIDSATSEP